VKDVEMAALFAARLLGDNLRRRHIEFALGKDLGQFGDVRVPKENNRIHNQSQAGFAVKNGGDAARGK
jgi:hypothetical protein